MIPITEQTNVWFAGGPGPVIPYMSFDDVHGHKSWMDRDDYTREYGFALLDQNMIKEIIPHGPFIEVGAGTGALANRLAHYGGDVIATDADDGEYAFTVSKHYTVEKSTATKAVKAYPDRTVVMSWPSYGGRWAFYALEAMVPDQKIIHIGEGRGGCTADDAFFNKLEKEFTHTEFISMRCWHGLHDHCDVYTKKGRKDD